MKAEYYCGIGPFTAEEIKALVKCEADSMDSETTLNFISDLVEVDEDDMQGHAPVEKAMWLVRHAYLSGFSKGIEVYNDAIQIALERNQAV